MPGFADDLYAGQVALVTGGATGIGLGVATAFAAHGAAVALTSRSEEHLREGAEQIRAAVPGAVVSTVACDVRDADRVTAMAAEVLGRHGQIDVLINNAAGNFPVAAEQMSPNQFATVVGIDLHGTFLVTRAVVGSMLAAGRGVVGSVVISDPQRGFPGFAHAGAAKAGIMSLTASWAREWGPRGVRTVAVGPGPVPTEGVTRNMLGYEGADWREAWRGVADGLPIPRVGTPDDVANALLFLCSDLAAWITGITVNVDGGLSLPRLGQQ